MAWTSARGSSDTGPLMGHSRPNPAVRVMSGLPRQRRKSRRSGSALRAKDGPLIRRKAPDGRPTQMRDEDQVRLSPTSFGMIAMPWKPLVNRTVAQRFCMEPMAKAFESPRGRSHPIENGARAHLKKSASPSCDLRRARAPAVRTGDVPLLASILSLSIPLSGSERIHQPSSARMLRCSARAV
jgi:hypothetical protein